MNFRWRDLASLSRVNVDARCYHLQVHNCYCTYSRLVLSRTGIDQFVVNPNKGFPQAEACARCLYMFFVELVFTEISKLLPVSKHPFV